MLCFDSIAEALTTFPWRALNLCTGFCTGSLRSDVSLWVRRCCPHTSEKPVTPVRTVAGLGFGTALLGMLAGCSSGGQGDALSVTTGTPALKRSATASASGLFSGPSPVSIVNWWRENPTTTPTAPANLGERRLLLNRRGIGPERFPGPDMSKYSQVLMVITCTSKAQYTVRLQVLDGLSIASTSGISCGGPDLALYTSPTLTSDEPETEVEVDVPAKTEYYVTLYGTPAN